ncbi:MAG: hypothetical protein NVS2B14_02940 [Chamaesiphon sp.]
MIDAFNPVPDTEQQATDLQTEIAEQDPSLEFPFISTTELVESSSSSVTSELGGTPDAEDLRHTFKNQE